MRKLSGLLLIGVLLLSGCASAEQIAAEKAQDQADIWAAMGNDEPMPAHDSAAVRRAISDIAERSNRIIMEGSTDADCEPYSDAFDVLLLAEFDDERQDYIAPLSNALSQVYSGCDGRGTWEGVIDDVVTVSDLGAEYANRF